MYYEEEYGYLCYWGLGDIYPATHLEINCHLIIIYLFLYSTSGRRGRVKSKKLDLFRGEYSSKPFEFLP